MRDLINIIELLSESSPKGLSPNEITRYEWRFSKFIDYIEQQKPFTTLDGNEVVLDPREARRFKNMYYLNQFTGALKAKLKTSDEEIPLSKLAKTKDFGGAAVAAGQDESEAGKEALIVKPSQIGICDKEIRAEDFYDTIANNAALLATDYGKVVTNLAEYITAGEVVMLPEEYLNKDKTKIRKAIVDYAGEYLGVLALLYNRSRFPRRAQFEKWLGASIEELTLKFPSKANTNLADSFALITNPNNSHSINISSKGTGGGAAPAISGLKIPDYIRENPTYDVVNKFIDICKNESTLQQPFSAMDLIYKSNPDSIDEVWHKFLPFNEKAPDLMELCKESIMMGKKREHVPISKKYAMLTKLVGGSGSDGGKIVYAMKKEVALSINKKDGIPEFKDAIIQILEMNFIQQYVDYSHGELTFATQWPAKLDGNISVENKSSGTDPTAGGFSFKLGRTDDSVSSNDGQTKVDGITADDEADNELSDIATTLAGNKEISKTPSVTSTPRAVGDVGREKRK